MKEDELKSEELEKEIKEKIESKKRNKITLIFLVIFGAVIIGFFAWVIIGNIQNNFEYMGVKFEVVNEIAPYRTNIVLGEKNAITGAVTQVPYYFYIRTDPRELEKIPFEGKLNLAKDMVINSTDPFSCDGNGILGMTNLARLLRAMGVNVIKDQTADCDIQGRYIFLNLEPGNETKIVQIGPMCYKMYINDCEVLESTERFMIEILVETNKMVGKE